MKKPKPLDLSSCEEMSRDEMRSMVAGTKNDIFDFGSGLVDSGTVLTALSIKACYGKRDGDECYFSFNGGYTFYGKCQYTIDPRSQKVLMCGSDHSSGSGNSGSSGGASWWDNFWNSDLKPQREGCYGKHTGDQCSWISNGSTYHGTCNFDDTTHYLLCAQMPSYGGATATGAISARQAACLNKVRGDDCWFIGDNGETHGHCRLDSFSWYKKLLACYTHIVSSGSGNTLNEGNEIL